MILLTSFNVTVDIEAIIKIIFNLISFLQSPFLFLLYFLH